MAAVDSFSLLYREIARSCHDSCNSCIETLALVGALYTASKAVILARDCYSMIRVHFIPQVMPSRRLPHRFGQWAVIYGASEAIARAYAAELARQGVSIVLISPDSVGMADAALAMSQTHGVEMLLVVADFTQGPAASEPVREVLRGKDVGFLVNCLEEGAEESKGLTELPEEKLWEMVHRNVAACTLMTRLVLPGMVERRRGAVVNIASGGGCRRTFRSGAALSASTAYLDSFARTLHHEYRGQGIFVQSLTPYRVASTSAEAGWLVPHPEVYARHAVSTLGLAPRTTGYWPHTLQYGVVRCVPEWLWVLGSRLISASG